MSVLARYAVALCAMALMVVGGAMAVELEKTYTFSGIKDVSIETITGDILLEVHDRSDVSVRLVNELHNPEILTPEVSADNGSLIIREVIRVNNPPGKTSWILRIPKSLTLDTLNALSALGDIEFRGFGAGRVKAHAATGEIIAEGLTASTLRLSTSSGAIRLLSSAIDEKLMLASSDGLVDIALDQLPKDLDAASSYGRVHLSVPGFGDAFHVDILKNADQGKIIMPFDCTNTETRKVHENDTYNTDICTVKRGTGGPKVRLLTGAGTIEIDTTGF